MTISLPELVIALVLVAVIGGGGFVIGLMTGTDRGEETGRAECRRRHPPVTLPMHLPPPAPVLPQPGPPIGVNWRHITVWRPTRPLPAAPADELHSGVTSPAAMELAVQLRGQQLEAEIAALCEAAELHIGRLTRHG